MRRRLDLASALIHTPQVLFLDEPTTGLDPVSRRAIWEEVRKLNDEGTTVFLTTQYLEEADQLADRVGIISGGRLVAEGTPQALKADVGKPHLELNLVEQEGKESRAEEVLARFGEPMPARDGRLMVELEHGTSEVGPIVVALNQAGLDVESLDLVQPTLDDVFVHKTGQHLEGAQPETDETEAIVE
jgi:ABC-2 type transport system ATP-binding protein